MSAIAAEIDSDQEVEPGADELPSLNGNNPDASASRHSERTLTPPVDEDASSVLPAISTKTDVLGTPQRRDKNPAAPLATPGALGLPSMPPPLTPSVTQVLSRAPDVPPPPLPAGLTVASLRSRLDGKKKIKYVRKKYSDSVLRLFMGHRIQYRGAILAPSEMEALTEPWRPYRSIGKLN